MAQRTFFGAASLLGILIASVSVPAFAEMTPSTKAEWKNFRYDEIRPDCRTRVGDVSVEYSYLSTTTDDGVNATANVVVLGFEEPGYRDGLPPVSSLPIGHPIAIRSTFGTMFNGVVAAHNDGRFYIATDQHFLGEWWYDDMMGLVVHLDEDTSTLKNVIIEHGQNVVTDRVKLSNSLNCAQEHRD